MPAAARVEDPITHSQSHTEATKQMWQGIGAGILIGVALVTVAAVAVAGSVVTGGAAAPVLIGAALVAGGTILSLGGKGFLHGARQGATHIDKHGQVKTGSSNVTINKRAAAAACLSLIECDEHGGPQKLAQGSRTVSINGKMASRVGDRSTCDGVIGAGSSNVSIGGATGQCAAISKEVADWETRLAKDAIVAGGVLQFVGMIIGLLPVAGALGAATGVARVILAVRTGLGLLGGYGFGKVGDHYGGQWFGAGSWQQEAMSTVSALVGGGLIGKASGVLEKVPGMFGGTPAVVETLVEPPVGKPPLVDRSTLNPEDIFPGKQSAANCAPQSAQQIIRAGTGNNIPEADMAASAKAVARYDPKVGTPAGRVPEILNANGVPARTMPNTPESIQVALGDGQGVISAHRAAELWPGDPNYVPDPDYPILRDAGHAVHTIDTVRDADGNVTGYLINDTGLGTAGRVVPAAQYEGSLMERVPATVTNDPIYTPYKPAEALASDIAPGAAGNDSLGVTTPDTIQHVHEGGTTDNPMSAYDGKWDKSGLHDWNGLQKRVAKDGYKITDVQENPSTGVRRVTIERSGDDPKIINKNERIRNILSKDPSYSKEVERDPQVTGSFPKTVYPKVMSASEIDMAGDDALHSASAQGQDPSTTLEPYGTNLRKDGSPADGYFEAPITTPQGATIRVQGWFTEDAGVRTITSHTPMAPKAEDNWPSVLEENW